MFVRAITAVTPFTKYILTLKAFADGHSECQVGTMIHLNADGWVITADHIIADYLTGLQGAQEWAEHERQCSAIRADMSLDENAKEKAIRRVKKPNAKAPQHVALASEGRILIYSGLERFPDIDVAVFQLHSFDSSLVSQYPTFFDFTGRGAVTGVSLCKLGFPFPEVQLTYFPIEHRFDLGQGTQLPYFPIEGMLTRYIDVAPPVAHRITYPRKMIEVSTPGLRGQSGGPVFDCRGRLWGIQSRIMTLPLGFDVEFKDGKGRVASKVPQVFHVGWVASSEAIVPILRELKIAFDVDDTSP